MNGVIEEGMVGWGFIVNLVCVEQCKFGGRVYQLSNMVGNVGKVYDLVCIGFVFFVI